MGDWYPFSEFDFEAVVQDKYSSSNNDFWTVSSDPLDQHHHNEDKGLKNVNISEAEDWGDSGNFGFFPDHDYSTQEDSFLSFTNQQKEQLSNLDYDSLDNLRFDMVVSSPLGDAPKFDDQILAMADLSRPNKNYQDQNLSLPLASLDLLNNYGNRLKRLYREIEPDEDNQLQPIDDLRERKKLSTEDVMRIAGAMFIRSSYSDQSEGLDYLIPQPYDCYYSSLSEEEKGDVKLAESLLASAEKVGLGQFERAAKLLDHCESQSSKTGNAVKRVVSYFCEALRERINRETGRACAPPFSPVGEIPRHYHKYREKEFTLFDPDKSMQNPGPTIIACHVQLPFCQVAVFAGIQAILDKLGDSKKVHMIDLGIRTGLQWTILMQALALRRECPLELLKITAVGTTEKDSLRETGKRLASFAKSMNIPFSFYIVTVSDMHELKEELFELDGEETIAVYAMFALRPLIAEADQLEAMMKVIRNLNPIVMVVTEVEANHNSKSFVKRFTEALFYFSAFFDCVEESMEGDDPNRTVLESLYLSYGIRDIVAAEGEKRKIRNVKIEVWRAFFERFGMVEGELSMSSLYQAELVAKRFAGGSFCTFDKNGTSLLCGWKGTPLYFVSVWKFL
ncbi:DELLA protein RGL1-like [Neltuma alba]|uniref:DELLA protein RGL1-like n=1 Tax=Neltuma alba TaxID=207710 RepID=UPI0010A42D97|nr:DELLA protein RGL1-like [Prosopis alba]